MFHARNVGGKTAKAIVYLSTRPTAHLHRYKLASIVSSFPAAFSTLCSQLPLPPARSIPSSIRSREKSRGEPKENARAHISMGKRCIQLPSRQPLWDFLPCKRTKWKQDNTAVECDRLISTWCIHAIQEEEIHCTQVAGKPLDGKHEVAQLSALILDDARSNRHDFIVKLSRDSSRVSLHLDLTPLPRTHTHKYIPRWSKYYWFHKFVAFHKSITSSSQLSDLFKILWQFLLWNPPRVCVVQISLYCNTRNYILIFHAQLFERSGFMWTLLCIFIWVNIRVGSAANLLPFRADFCFVSLLS